jgi:hypothetical protein
MDIMLALLNFARFIPRKVLELNFKGNKPMGLPRRR